MIKLDKSREVCQVIKRKQYDTLEPITIELNNNGVPVNLSGYLIRLECLKSDNTIVIQDTNIVVKNVNQIEILLNSQITILEGEAICQLVLVKNGLMDTSFSFYINVQPSIIKNGVASASFITILDTLISKISDGTTLNNNLDSKITTGNILNTNLGSKISTGTTLNTNLASNTTLANTANTNITSKTTTATSTNTTLTNTNTTALATNTTLNTTINNANNAKIALDTSISNGNLYTRKRFSYTSTANNTTQFTLDSSYVVGNMLELIQVNLMLFEGDDYSRSGNMVTLGVPMSNGEKLYYYINKNN